MIYPRTCTVCGDVIGYTARTQYDQCVKHRVRAAPDENYKCKECGAVFATFRNAKNHRLRKHGWSGQPFTTLFMVKENGAWT